MHSWKTAISRPEKPPSPEADPGHTLILDLQPPELWEVHFCCLSPAFVVFVRAAWADKFQEPWKYPWGTDGPEPPIWTSTVPTPIRETTFVTWSDASSMKVPRLHSSKSSRWWLHLCWCGNHAPRPFWVVSQKQVFPMEFCLTFKNKCYTAWGWSTFSPSKAWGQWNYNMAFVADLCFWKQVSTEGVWGH